VFTATLTGMERVDASKELIGTFYKSLIISGLLSSEVYVAEILDTEQGVGCAIWFGSGHTTYDRHVVLTVPILTHVISPSALKQR
jgi:hypothetical protein